MRASGSRISHSPMFLNILVISYSVIHVFCYSSTSTLTLTLTSTFLLIQVKIKSIATEADAHGFEG